MKIYRVCKKNNVGPYRGDELFEYFQSHSGENPRTPGPFIDGVRDEVSRVLTGFLIFDLNFAFRNLPAVYRWFTTEEAEILRQYEYGISVWEAPRIASGKSGQCAFLQDESKKLFWRKMPLTLDKARQKCKIVK
jgi:hypothetical protein